MTPVGTLGPLRELVPRKLVLSNVFFKAWPRTGEISEPHDVARKSQKA
jgi:hypothetical protein